MDVTPQAVTQTSAVEGRRDFCRYQEAGRWVGRRFCGISWMHGYPAILGCRMEIVFVRCRQQLKYTVKEIYVATPATAARQGGKVAANLVDLCELLTAEYAECAEDF